MSNNKRVVETRGADIEKAVASALEKLGLQRSDVIVEVLDEGSRGLLGLGSRDAVVRVTEINARPSRVAEQPASKAAPTPEPAPEKPVKPVEEAPKQETAVSPPPPSPKPASPPPQPPSPPKKSPKPMEEIELPSYLMDDEEDEEDEVEVVQKPVQPKKKAPATNGATPPEPPADEAEQLEQEQATAMEIINALIEQMSVDATISASLTEPDDLTGRRMNVIEIQGDDLGVLIGPRGETLSSLQYIARLMVGHRLRQRANFVIDVEGYRKRREKALQRLAERMAQKALKRGRPIGLEPMPPHERRVIHMTLREHENVYTQSVGEGSRRKVRIVPK